MYINDTLFSADLLTIIYELKSQLTLNGINYLGVIKDSPSDVMISCPYHKDGQEKRPSAGIRKSDGQFHCFACGEVHSLQEVVSHCFGKDEDYLGAFGWNWLRKNFLTVNVEERNDIILDIDRSSVLHRHNSNTHSDSNDNRFVTEEELDKYRYTHPYWGVRGITDECIIELFDLGYDKTTNSITMPVRNIHGQTLFVARRSVKTKFFNYPQGVEKPLYGLYELANMNIINGSRNPNKYDIFVCESMIDCILLWQGGHYCVALNGTGTELQFKQLSALPCRNLVLCTDNDEAGQKARTKLKDNVKNKIFSEIIFPNGIKDVGDLGKAKRFDDIQNIRKWETI